MLRSPFFRRLFLPYLVLICAATGGVGMYAARTLHQTYEELQKHAMHDTAILVSQLLAPRLPGAAPADLLNEVREIGRLVECRVTVMRGDGVVIADTEADPASMENHRARPEFASAAAAGEGADIRPSHTINNAPLMYLARPVVALDGKPALSADGQPYYVRLALHMQVLRDRLSTLYAALASATAVAIVAAALICFFFARRAARPMVDLTGFADALSRGELDRRTLEPERTGEIATLATSLNTMADSLQHLLEQTAKGKAELSAIVSSMSEGVIATDASQRILLVNDAAGKLLGFDSSSAAGKLLWEVVRSEQILKAAGDVLAGARQSNIGIGPLASRYLDVTLCTFSHRPDAGGLVVVAHDITQAYQYQELRKEFVANVSHELRTPLTLIRGFVETLQDGAWRDEHKAQEYLAVIARHADQLTNLVGDLLELSRLESQGLSASRKPVDLDAVIRRAHELLLPAAQRKHQTIALDLSPGLPPIVGNADYLERAVANLIDNASKYTPEGGHIAVRARADRDGIRVEVEDDGIGIPVEDIPRIFERFYRVDRSRSREMGGTGLGLSIVKHVAQVHGGTVEVDSEPGKGSVFRLRIPAGDV